MTDKELRHLNRRELIDIIYELQKRYADSENEVERLQADLNRKALSVSESGSIAEAALKVNGIFEAAQAAADQYLLSIKTANTDMAAKIERVKRQSEEVLQQANLRAASIVQEAEKKAATIVSNANQEAEASWNQFQKKADELIRARAELSDLVKRN